MKQGDIHSNVSLFFCAAVHSPMAGLMTFPRFQVVAR